MAVVLPLFFAGSAGRLADGTQIAGIDVGGLSPTAARTLLERRSASLARVPIAFTAGGKRYPVTARAMGVQVDWAAAVAAADRAGSGLGVVRGYRRLALRFFPQHVVPAIRSYGAAVDYELSLLGGGGRQRAPRGDARSQRAAHHDRAGDDRPQARSRGRPKRARALARVVLARSRRAAGARRPAADHRRPR